MEDHIRMEEKGQTDEAEAERYMVLTENQWYQSKVLHTALTENKRVTVQNVT